MVKKQKPRKDAKRFYLITHARKGQFTAELLHEGDDMFRVAIDTSPGSGQERLANVKIRDEDGNKMTPAITEKLLLKSLITSMEEVHGRH